MTGPVLTSRYPPVEVQPPAFVPYRYGLLSAAEVIDGDGRWELGGVAYTTSGCPNRTAEWVTSCPTDPPSTDPPPEKDIPTGLDEVSGRPFLLYDSAACYPQSGRTEEELLRMARQNLIGGEQVRLEEKLWAQVRQDAIIVAPPAGATEWEICLAVGTLDDLLAKTYGGIGVLHAPRWLIGPAKKVHRRDGERMYDPADNHWSFGAGYSRLGPPVDGDANNEALPGNVWIFATGPVVVRRSKIQSHSTFGIRDNERRAVAERSYVLTVECPALAVQVKIPEC